MFLWKADIYKIDPKCNKPKVCTYQRRAKGTKNLDEIKKLIDLEYSHFIVGAYNVSVPSGWMVSIP